VTASFAIAQGNYEGVYQRPNFQGAPKATSMIASTASGRRRSPMRSCGVSGSAARERHRGKKGSTQAAPRLYDLTTLQREANNASAAARRTLQIAQALYERHK